MPGPRPRLVATDLDGTLVRSDGTVSDYTREVLLELDRRGVPVVFVTGRPLRWAEEVFEHVGSHGLAVVSNGALVWDVAPARVHARARRSSPTLGLEVCRLRPRGGARHGVRGRDAARASRWSTASASGTPCPTAAGAAPSRSCSTRPALKLLARHEELAPQEFWDAAEAAVGGRLVDHLVVDVALLEISAPGVTKASTLALLCAEPRDRRRAT